MECYHNTKSERDTDWEKYESEANVCAKLLHNQTRSGLLIVKDRLLNVAAKH